MRTLARVLITLPLALLTCACADNKDRGDQSTQKARTEPRAGEETTRPQRASRPAAPRDASARESALARVADFGDFQVTGVAVSSRGRVFVNFPLWSGPHELSVAEVMPDSSWRAYPDQAWNAKEGAPGAVGATDAAPTDEDEISRIEREARGGAPSSAGTDAANAPNQDEGYRFICVQSVFIDDKDRLWILDPASPQMQGVVQGGEGGGPKLVQIDLATDRVVRVYPFSADIAPFNSYLNDVRIDVRNNFAFITDSGLGAIVVLDLSTGRARRLLEEDPSTKANPSLVPVVQGVEWRQKSSGEVKQIQSDGIALDQKNNILYWQSLTNDRLYAIDSRVLMSESVPAFQVSNSARDLGRTCITDGMAIDGVGDLYFTALERDAVVRLDGSYARAAFKDNRPRDFSKSLRNVAHHPNGYIGWPDSIAIGGFGPSAHAANPPRPNPRGGGGVAGQFLYVTSSQLHRGPEFIAHDILPADSPDDGSDQGPGYAVWRIRLREGR